MTSVKEKQGLQKSDEKDTLLKEYDSANQEYRYSDQLLVQEFYFGIVVMGVLANIIKEIQLPQLIQSIAAIVTAILLSILSIHLGHLLEDRNLVWERSLQLEKRLNFNVRMLIWDTFYKKGAKKKRRLSGTNLMLWSTRTFTLVWIFYAAYTIYLLF